MRRTVKEWIGETPDQRVPKRVELRVFELFRGRCAICTRLLFRGYWALDHKIALINGGDNRESNLQPVCNVPCHSDKTRADVRDKSKTYQVASRHVGAGPRPRSITGWRRFNGDQVRAPRQRR